MMKKLIALSMAAMMALALCACGNTSGDGSDSSANGGSAADAGSATDGSAQTDVLVMATNAYFPPYEYYQGEEIVGIDVDIAQAVADKLGMTLKVEDMEFDSIITAVQTGKADMGLAGMTVTPDRMENVNFSESYATGVQSVIVVEGSDIVSLDDLAGKKIGVQLATTGDIYASDEFGADFVEQFNKGNDAVMALVQGKIDAVIIDNEPAKSYVAANEGLVILDTEYAVEDYAICISKENDDLLEKVNAALAELKADGTLQAILDTYITAE